MDADTVDVASGGKVKYICHGVKEVYLPVYSAGGDELLARGEIRDGVTRTQLDILE